MKKRNWILIFLAIFVLGFVAGYVIMSFDIKYGFWAAPDNRSIWQILSPI